MQDPSNYYNLQEKNIKQGGVKLIKISTPKGDFNVFTKQIGNNPTKKLLLLHGGPGATHEYFHSFESYIPMSGIQLYYYDQLGSFNSDKPQGEEYNDLWTLERYVEEVEQVRIGLGLDNTNFYVLGHSWGGILLAEYALKYQKNIKGMIISNMMMNMHDYNHYGKKVLGPKTFPPEIYTEIMEIEKKQDYENPRYMEILMQYYYPQHVLRLPPPEWPYSVNKSFENLNQTVYVKIQGPSEFGCEVGDLKDWNVMDKLSTINAPTLVIAGKYDTMDPVHMKKVSELLPNGQYLLCENGSHMSMWDDQDTYFQGLIKFINETDKQ